MINKIKTIYFSLFKISFGQTELITKGLNWFTGILLSFLLAKDDFGKVGVLLAIYNLGILSFSAFVQHLVFKKNYPVKIKEFLILLSPFILLLSVLFYYVISINFLDIFLVLISSLIFSINKVDFSYYRLNNTVKPFYKKKLIYQFAFLLLVLFFAILFKTSLSYSLSLFLASIIIIDIKKISFKKIKILELKYIFYYFLPFFFSGVFKNVSRYFDRIYISSKMSNFDAGAYTLLFMFSSIILMANFALNSNLEQKFYVKNKFNIKKKYFLISYVMNLILPFVSIAFFQMYLYFNNNYYGLMIPLILLLCSNCLIPYYTVGIIKLNKSNKQKLIPILTLICSSFNIILNVLIIPHYGIFGASAIAFFTSVLQTLIIVKFARLNLSINFYTFLIIGISCMTYELYVN